MKKLFGVITAMTTPFTAENEVNYAAIREQVGFLVDKGVHCLYPCGTTGEMYLLSLEERKKIADTVVKAADGRVTVFVHCGAMREEETIELAQHAHEIGADGVGIVTPSYFHVDDRAMIAYYSRVCSALPDDFPIYVYVIPQLAHNDVSAETLEIIADQCKNVVGVKYSYPDMRRINEYLQVREGNFSVVPGADDLFLPCLACGCDGVVSGCSGPFPEAFIRVYEAYKVGDISKAQECQVKASELARKMKFGGDMSIFKNILKMRGVEGGHMRKPLLDLTQESVEELRRQFKKDL